jgi:hypothetical protein
MFLNKKISMKCYNFLHKLYAYSFGRLISVNDRFFSVTQLFLLPYIFYFITSGICNCTEFYLLI